MRREWSPDELIESWTLVGQDRSLVGNKTGATRLGFALLLKFFEIEARFPRAVEELPDAAVGYVADRSRSRRRRSRRTHGRDGRSAITGSRSGPRSASGSSLAAMRTS